MANIKSAKKRVIVNRTKAERNKAIRSEVKTSIKKVEAAVAAKDLAAAQAALKVATATIESACSKGVYHKNNAARKVSRLFFFVALYPKETASGNFCRYSKIPETVHFRQLRDF